MLARFGSWLRMLWMASRDAAPCEAIPRRWSTPERTAGQAGAAVRGRAVQAPLGTRQVSTWMLLGCGLWLVALGLYFIFFRPPLLPEDTRFMDSSLAQIRAVLPGLEHWLEHVFTVLGGFMAGTGALTVFVAREAMPSRLPGTSWALGLGGAFTVALMSASNFSLNSDFRWALLVPALLWLVGLVLYVARR